MNTLEGKSKTTFSRTPVRKIKVEDVGKPKYPVSRFIYKCRKVTK